MCFLIKSLIQRADLLLKRQTRTHVSYAAFNNVAIYEEQVIFSRLKHDKFYKIFVKFSESDYHK